MDLNDIAVFVKVAELGSFTRAALVLEAPKSTVSAKVAALERALGVTLLHRTTRKLRMSVEGEEFFKTCVTALAEIEAASALVSSGQKAPQGRIAVTVPHSLGEHFMPAFLKKFLAERPGISVALTVTNRYVDLIGENIDVAVRAGDLGDTGLIARRIGVDQWGLFAAPSYLAASAKIGAPADLARHECLRWGREANDTWQLKRDGRTSRVKIRGRIFADDLSTLKELAVFGHGVALLPAFFAQADVANGRLSPILESWSTDAVPISIVYPARKYLQARLRVFIDEMAAALGQHYFALDRRGGGSAGRSPRA